MLVILPTDPRRIETTFVGNSVPGQPACSRVGFNMSGLAGIRATSAICFKSFQAAFFCAIRRL